LDQNGDVRLLEMAHNQIHTLDGVQLLGGSLGQTSSDDDFSFGIFPNRLPQCLTRLHGGATGHRARIDDDQIGGTMGLSGCAPGAL
jgi:hypothetical protein